MADQARDSLSGLPWLRFRYPRLIRVSVQKRRVHTNTNGGSIQIVYFNKNCHFLRLENSTLVQHVANQRLKTWMMLYQEGR